MSGGHVHRLRSRLSFARALGQGTASRGPIDGTMRTWAFFAMASAIIGLILTLSLPPDPWPYVGGAMVAVAPVIALVALIRDPSRKAAAFALAVAMVPVAVLTLLLYLLATRSS